jgi:hypothetical protein
VTDVKQQQEFEYMKTFLLIPALVIGVGIFAADTKPPTIQEIERLPFDDAFQQWLPATEIQGPTPPWTMGGSTDLKTGKFTPTAFWALTCRLGQDAHLHQSFLVSALNTNAQVSLILDSSPVLCRGYAVNSEAMVRFDPKDGYTSVTRGWVSVPEVRRSVWLDAMKKTQPALTNKVSNLR